MSNAVDQRKLDAEVSAELFGQHLRRFVDVWAPRGISREEFLMDLTRLMVDAMRHKSDRLGQGMAFYADAAWAELAMRPVNVIFRDLRDGEEKLK